MQGVRTMRSEREILIRNINDFLKHARLRDLKFVFTYISNCPKEEGNHDEKNS